MTEEVVVTPQAEDAPLAPVQNPQESAPAPTGEDTPSTASEPVKQPEPNRGHARFERKISRLYREAAEQKARADLLEQQLTNLAKPDDGPRLEQFDDVQKYAQAYAEHEKAKALREQESQYQHVVQTRAAHELSAGWESKVLRAESKYADFDAVVGEIHPNTPVGVALMKAENGEDVAYYLGTHMDEAAKITTLDPVDQLIAIGRISAKLQSQPPQPRRVSAAPAPIEPVSGTRAPAVKGSQDVSDYKEFLRARNRELGRT